ncbi:MAG: Spo0B C-terminal domain-containing protein [Niallia sp.]
MNKDWNTIEFLRHVRHDWLNKIQLIKGNLDLNKPDRVKEIINEIITETKQEAKLSNLDIPQFATKLLVANWENYYFRLEYEVLAEEKCQITEDETLTDWITMFFETLNQHIKPFADNHLFISIHSMVDGLRLYVDFNGILINAESMSPFLQQPFSKQLMLENIEINNKELVFEVWMNREKTGK